MATPTTPLYLVHNAIWAMIESRSAITSQVRVGNRLKLAGDDGRFPFKDSVLDADLPELRVVPIGSTTNIHKSSNTVEIVHTLEVQLTTGKLTVDRLLDLQFELLRAMVDWETHLRPMSWKSKNFVTLTEPVSIDDGLNNSELDRGLHGWISIFACRVIMHFDVTDMLDDA